MWDKSFPSIRSPSNPDRHFPLIHLFANLSLRFNHRSLPLLLQSLEISMYPRYKFHNLLEDNSSCDKLCSSKRASRMNMEKHKQD
ncbi:hypothetical protein LguiA_007044 [Lonicera macranthoides]